ncbi:unnamed protein product [Pieris macdunnoughi]|uniref:Uncharacterized protein n=1 Tax=Pieris macdunnoughi TaxID=345717 RepID=A0A821XKZ5_9NEOP|nr:unnamed protein product [Pieris macdunnoughi]
MRWSNSFYTTKTHIPWYAGISTHGTHAGEAAVSIETIPEETPFWTLWPKTELVQKCVHFQGDLSSERILIKPDSGSSKSLSSFLRNQNLENIYPYLDIAVHMAMCTYTSDKLFG